MNDSDRIRAAYDAVPYDSFPYAVTHPDRMAVIGALNGVPGAQATGCRMLELGCASAGNLIPMAELLPNSRFIGIDLSPRQIEQGNALVQALGLRNIELRCQSIMDFPADEGPFDYIIAHGLYSWVPDDVREKLMEICARQLAPRGLCFISCKTYPGWHLNNVLRDLMLFHARNESGVTEQATAGQQALEFAISAFDSPAPQALVVKQMAGNLRNLPEMFLSHDHMAVVSHPVLFHQFAQHAQTQGLRYLGHADPTKELFWHFPPAMQQKITSFSASPIDREQYIDFLCWRSIRGNILCRADAPSAATSDVIASMHVAGRLQESAAGDPNSPNPAVKFSIGERFLALVDPVMIHAFRSIAKAWPASVTFRQIIDSMPREITGDSATLPARVADQLSIAFRGGMIELWTQPVDYMGQTNANPRTSKLARWQAAHGANITTFRHETYIASEPARRLIMLLDGSRNPQALQHALAGRVAPAEVELLLKSLASESLLLA